MAMRRVIVADADADATVLVLTVTVEAGRIGERRVALGDVVKLRSRHGVHAHATTGMVLGSVARGHVDADVPIVVLLGGGLVGLLGTVLAAKGPSRAVVLVVVVVVLALVVLVVVVVVLAVVTGAAMAVVPPEVGSGPRVEHIARVHVHVYIVVVGVGGHGHSVGHGVDVGDVVDAILYRHRARWLVVAVDVAGRGDLDLGRWSRCGSRT